MDKKITEQKKNDKAASKYEERIKEFEENWKRALADYKNLEKRSQEEKTSMVEFANRVLVENMLPVLDNFVMIEKHSDDQGIKISIAQFRQILEQAGLQEIRVEPGQGFDPQKMDAIETNDGEHNKVTAVIRKGYFFKSKLIRPTSVKVGHGQKTEKED